MSDNQKRALGVLTSGGDSPGMNAALRAVVRNSLRHGLDVYAVFNGYQGMVAGGAQIRLMTWDAVGGIMQLGGTRIGTARSEEFLTRAGRRMAAKNLIQNDIDRLVVIGGDGSLTGALIFREEWPDLIAELVTDSEIDSSKPQAHPSLKLVGITGSIDNDMFGTDMTIGADTALQRITEAVDAISSTAASHHRSFIVEVMGRHCGYLALMGAISSGADWVLIPEHPSQSDDWVAEMCASLKASRLSGRTHNIVILAEGAQDKFGKPITSMDVKQAIETRLGEEARITILGHVQRGGSPSAFDRYLGTIQGFMAVEHLLADQSNYEPQLIGIRQNNVVTSPLMACVEQTKQVAKLIEDRDYEKAMEMRGGSFAESYQHFRTIIRSHPNPSLPGDRQLRLAVMHSGGLAPGMNTAVRVATRLGLDRGHAIVAVHNGFAGLIEDEFDELNWMSVSGWVARGGAEIGTSRTIPKGSDFYSIAKNLESAKIDGLLMIGGWTGYQAMYELFTRRVDFPAFNIPLICLPASIDNNLPGSDLSIGADTALNNIVTNVDKIKQSAVASRRCFIVEVMGRDCGYLALLSSLASGAERAYIPEVPLMLKDLVEDVSSLRSDFERGKRLGLIIRNETAGGLFDTRFISTLFEQEGGEWFDVRETILGYIQQGGNPSPFDRIQATRLAARCIDYLIDEAGKTTPAASAIGLIGGKAEFTNLYDYPRLMETHFQRPVEQWWLKLRPIINFMTRPSV